jgi:CubicO group peptidase (beta-lactamase class C family)
MRHILFLLILAMPGNVVFGQNKDLDKKLNGLDAYVGAVMHDWSVQGVSIAIVYKNKIVLSKGYGYRDKEKKLPVTSQTLFAIGSCTKAFTAAGLCLLEDEDKLELDKPVRDYLPDFKLQDDYVSANITLRDLLCHRSGLPRHDLLWYGAPFSRRELYERLQYLEPSKPFRTAYQYQNLMFMVAGMVAGQVAQQSWEDFTRDRLLVPLEMATTNFSVDALQKASDFAIGYSLQNDTVKVIPYMNIDALGPAGAINSSADDMSHWLVALINGGRYKGKKVLSENIVRRLQTPTMTTPAEVPIRFDESFYNSYGLGWVITSYRGHVRVDHGGNIDGFSASTCFLPKDSIGVVVLSNMSGTPLPAIVRNQVLDRMLGLSLIDWNGRFLTDENKNKDLQARVKKEEDDLHRVKDTKPSHPLAAFCGKFEDPAYGVVEISNAGSNLHADLHGLRTELAHYHYDVFQATSKKYFQAEKFQFITGLDGSIDVIRIRLEPAVKDIEFKRILQVLDVRMPTLANYTGDYDFGGRVARVYLKEASKLYLFLPGQPEYELAAIKPNEFKIKILDGFQVRFEVDASGKANELVSIQPNGTFRAKRK